MLGSALDADLKFDPTPIHSDGVIDAPWRTFATEQEAKDNGRQEIQWLIEMWNKK